MIMNLFKRARDNPITKWHKRAWMINPNKTRIVFVTEAMPKRKHVPPPWIFREIGKNDSSIQDTCALNKDGIEYDSPVGCPVGNVTETSSVRADNWNEFLLSRM